MTCDAVGDLAPPGRSIVLGNRARKIPRPQVCPVSRSRMSRSSFETESLKVAAPFPLQVCMGRQTKKGATIWRRLSRSVFEPFANSEADAGNAIHVANSNRVLLGA